MGPNTKNIYFLSSKKALNTLFKDRTVEQKTKNKSSQYYFYDGSPLDSDSEYLINVPLSKVIEYFYDNPEKAPVKIDTDFPNLPKKQAKTVKNDIIAAIQTAVSLKNYRDTDAYFLDRELAHKVALEQNRVQLGHPTIDGLQICFHDGDPFPNAPKNLISAPLNEIYDILVETRLRFPKKIILPTTSGYKEFNEIQTTFNQLLQSAQKKRKVIEREYVKITRETLPNKNIDQVKNIFFISDRMTTVMQYATKGLAAAFKELGHNVFVSQENNDMESLHSAWKLRDYSSFQPDIQVNINHTNNRYIHKDIVNVMWWQDIMPELTSNEPLFWREKDFIFSSSLHLDKLLHNKNAKNIKRQSFCYDDTIFNVSKDVKKEKKIIFIGSSYHRFIEELPKSKKDIIQGYLQKIENGLTIPRDVLVDLVSDLSLPADYKTSLPGYIMNYLTRDSFVKWLCEQDFFKVEIYGRGWEYDPVIKTHFKGELPHGEDVADKYNSATHTLVALPGAVNSQRLVEASACGCIPVIYDTRDVAEKPHWDDEALFFKSKTELLDCLGKSPKNDPVIISLKYTYKAFAKKIITLANQPQI